MIFVILRDMSTHSKLQRIPQIEPKKLPEEVDVYSDHYAEASKVDEVCMVKKEE